VHGGAVRSDLPGLPAQEVSLAEAIGRPRLSVTCLNNPLVSTDVFVPRGNPFRSIRNGGDPRPLKPPDSQFVGRHGGEFASCTACSTNQCRSNPVSGRNLPKTGIFQMSAGDYRLYRSGNTQNQSRRLVAKSQKPAIGGPFCEYQGQFLQSPDCLAGDAVLIAPVSKQIPC
jgi:hypothetical protein